MALNLKTTNCANHPERMAQALCMQCQKSLCQECATSWEGINYCAVCLEKTRSAAETKSSGLQWAFLLAVVVLLFCAANVAMVWFGANFNFLF